MDNAVLEHQADPPRPATRETAPRTPSPGGTRCTVRYRRTHRVVMSAVTAGLTGVLIAAGYVLLGTAGFIGTSGQFRSVECRAATTAYDHGVGRTPKRTEECTGEVRLAGRTGWTPATLPNGSVPAGRTVAVQRMPDGDLELTARDVGLVGLVSVGFLGLAFLCGAPSLFGETAPPLTGRHAPLNIRIAGHLAWIGGGTGVLCVVAGLIT